jgi:YhcH/YjgK/YiaL family protein
VILDDRSRASLYFGLHPRLRTALTFLQGTALEELSPGRHAIDGDDVFAMVSDYDTRTEGESQWEAHRVHVDVQYVIQGRERIGVAPLHALHLDPYDAEKDILFARGAGEFVTLTQGRFIVLFQHDAHMPGIVDGAREPVRKLVIKVRMDPQAISA